VDPVVLLPPLGLAAVAGAGWLTLQWEQRHRRALAALAEQRGWTFTASDDSWTAAFPGTPFGTGRRRRARNVLYGVVDGRETVAFEYSFSTVSGDGNGNQQARTHRFAVAAVLLPEAVPTVELGPRTVLSRLASALGAGDVELESEDFHRRYRVAAHDPRFASDVLHPRTMEQLLAGAPAHPRLAGRDALTWDAGRQTPARVLHQLETLTAVVGGIPSYVWTDRGAGPRAPGAPP
jgi:hypothetical protein